MAFQPNSFQSNSFQTVDAGAGALGSGPDVTVITRKQRLIYQSITQPVFVSSATSASVNLTGLFGTGTLGSVIPQNTQLPTGRVGTGTLGSTTPQITTLPTGLAGSGAIGSVIPQNTQLPTGLSGKGTLGALVPQVAAIPSGMTWDPAKTGTNNILSNGNLTIGPQVASTAGTGVVANTSFATGKFYFEITINLTLGADHIGIGFADSSYTPNTGAWVGADTHAIGFWDESAGLQVFYNDAVIATFAGINAWAPGDVIRFAVDYGAGLVWVNKNGGNWNGSSSNDPATGVGGQAITITGPFSPATTVEADQDQITANFGASGFSFAVPSGFARDDGRFGWGTIASFTPQLAELPTGRVGTGTLGSVIPQDTQLPTGIAANGVLGSFIPNVTVFLTGLFGTGIVGPVTIPGSSVNATVTLTGLVGSGKIGSLIPNDTVFVGVDSYTKWNAGDKSSRITLSNNSLTATGSGTNTYQNIRATDHFTTGKYYFEVTINVPDTNEIGIGFTNANLDINVADWIGHTANGIAFFPGDPNVYTNGANPGFFGETFPGTPSLAGDVVQVAIDYGAGLIWYRVNTDNWNGTALADPALGSGGGPISISGPYYPALTLFNANDQATANFGASSFAFSVPTGFGVFTTKIGLNATGAIGTPGVSFSRTVVLPVTLLSNSNQFGAVVGTPGTPPTDFFWEEVTNNGFNAEIIGSGDDGTGSYCDYRIFGTTTASPAYINLGLTNALFPCGQGQLFDFAYSAKIVGGDQTNLGFGFHINEFDSGQSYITQNGPGAVTLSASKTAYSGEITIFSPNAAYCRPYFQWFNFSGAGFAVDITLRIYLPFFNNDISAVGTVASVHVTHTPLVIVPIPLADSGPIIVDHDGQIIQNWHVVASDASDAITVSGFSNVTIRNCKIEHNTGVGINFGSADNLTIQDCQILCTGSPPIGQNPSSGMNNITGFASNNVVVTRVRVENGSSGFYALQCSVAVSFFEGHNMRGPFPRGQLFQSDKSTGSLTNFSVQNDVNIAWTEDCINIFNSPNFVVDTGLIDGCNSPAGFGVMVEQGSNNTQVSNVDVLNWSNGGLGSVASDGVIYTNGRVDFSSITGYEGRGPPSSNSLAFGSFFGATNTQFVNCIWGTHLANPNNILFSAASCSVIDITGPVAFTPRNPLALTLQSGLVGTGAIGSVTVFQPAVSTISFFGLPPLTNTVSAPVLLSSPPPGLALGITLLGIPPVSGIGIPLILQPQFDLSWADIIIQAYALSGYSPQTIETSDMYLCLTQLNIIMSDWLNQHVIDVMIDLQIQPLNQGQISFVAPVGTDDIHSMVVTHNGTDLAMARISELEYREITNKQAQGLPSQYYVQRTPYRVSVFIWQSSFLSTDSLKYYRIKQLQDAVVFNEVSGLPKRWLYALVTELSCFIAKLKRLPPDVIQVAEARAQMAFMYAAKHETDRSNLKMI